MTKNTLYLKLHFHVTEHLHFLPKLPISSQSEEETHFLSEFIPKLLENDHPYYATSLDESSLKPLAPHTNKWLRLVSDIAAASKSMPLQETKWVGMPVIINTGRNPQLFNLLF